MSAAYRCRTLLDLIHAYEAANDPCAEPLREVLRLELQRLSSTEQALLDLAGLRGCPFCGSSKRWHVPIGTRPEPLAVQCGNCRAQGPSAMSRARADQLWDARPGLQ